MQVLQTVIRKVVLDQALVKVMMLLQVLDRGGEVDLALKELVS